MSSETDTSSSSSSDLERKRKLLKKLKKKSEKKSKKHKKEKKKKSHKAKKRSRKESTSSEEDFKIQRPIAPPRNVDMLHNDEGVDSFGPALPAHLINKECSISKSTVIGPLIPEEFLKIKNALEEEVVQSSPHKSQNSLKSDSDEDEEILQGSYGPLPVTSEREMTSAQIELEQRALELKMAAIDGITTSQSDQKVREEWMLELPEVGLKSGLAALNNMKRGFHQGKEKPDFSDRTSWTKTPQSSNDKHKPTTAKISKEELEQQARDLYEKQRDAEQEAMAKKHKKKHKRDESLVDIHQKKLRKEERKRAKELKESGAKPERRRFTRDVDLKLNKIDRNQTKQIVDKAKILNTKFSSGHSKYL